MKRLIILYLIFCPIQAFGAIVLIDDIAPKAHAFNVIVDVNYIGDANGNAAISATFDEINYLSGVTSAIQTQLDLKSPLASPTFTGTVTIPTPFTLGATSITTTGTQFNYLNAATGTTGTTSTNLVFSTSPTLVTPALGTIASGVGTALTALNGENIQDDTIDDDSIDFSDVTGADLTLTDCGAITSSGTITGLYFNSTETDVDQESTPSVVGSQTAILHIDGSASTGTNETYDSIFEAIKFTTTDAVTVRSFKVKLKTAVLMTLDTGYIYAQLRANSGTEKPLSTSLSTSQTRVYYPSLTTSYVEYEFQITSSDAGVSLSASTSYWLVLRKSGTPSETIYIDGTNSGSGEHAYSGNGVIWTLEDNKLGWFKLYGRTDSGGSFYSQNNDTLYAESVTGKALYGVSVGGDAIYGLTTSGDAIYGSASGGGVGVYGTSSMGYGVYGVSVTNYGLYAVSQNNSALVAKTTIGNSGSTIVAAHIYNRLISTNDTKPVMNLYRQSSGTVLDNLGGSLDFYVENDNGDDELSGRIGTVLTDVSDGSEDSALTFYTRAGGAAAAEVMRVSDAGIISTGTIVGAATRIKLLPDKFVVAHNYGNFRTGDNTGDYFTTSSYNDYKATAFIQIPDGYKATAVMIYGADANDTINVYECLITDGTTATNKGSGVVGTEIDITDIPATTTNYMAIYLSSGAADAIYGGYVSIEGI